MLRLYSCSSAFEVPEIERARVRRCESSYASCERRAPRSDTPRGRNTMKILRDYCPLWPHIGPKTHFSAIAGANARVPTLKIIPRTSRAHSTSAWRSLADGVDFRKSAIWRMARDRNMHDERGRDAAAHIPLLRRHQLQIEEVILQWNKSEPSSSDSRILQISTS